MESSLVVIFNIKFLLHKLFIYKYYYQYYFRVFIKIDFKLII